MSEAIIQRKIIRVMEESGWYVIKLIQTNKNGIPDLLCLKASQTVFIEVKKDKNKPSPLQQYRIGELNKLNIQTIIAYGLKEITCLCSKQTSSLK